MEAPSPAGSSQAGEGAPWVGRQLRGSLGLSRASGAVTHERGNDSDSDRNEVRHWVAKSVTPDQQDAEEESDRKNETGDDGALQHE